MEFVHGILKFLSWDVIILSFRCSLDPFFHVFVLRDYLVTVQAIFDIFSITWKTEYNNLVQKEFLSLESITFSDRDNYWKC